MTTTPEQIAEAARLWNYMPFRRCWVVFATGSAVAEYYVKPTAHSVSALARKGYTVIELKKS